MEEAMRDNFSTQSVYSLQEEHAGKLTSSTPGSAEKITCDQVGGVSIGAYPCQFTVADCRSSELTRITCSKGAANRGGRNKSTWSAARSSTNARRKASGGKSCNGRRRPLGPSAPVSSNLRRFHLSVRQRSS